MYKVTDCVIAATKVEEFIPRVFYDGLALGWKPFSVNQLMLLRVFCSKTECIRSKTSQTVVIFKVWLYHLHTLHCASRNENERKREDWIIG